MLICLQLVQEQKSAIAKRISLAANPVLHATANVFALFIVNMAFFAVAGHGDKFERSPGFLSLLSFLFYGIFYAIGGGVIGLMFYGVLLLIRQQARRAAPASCARPVGRGREYRASAAFGKNRCRHPLPRG
jgi:hypothetical protein